MSEKLSGVRKKRAEIIGKASRREGCGLALSYPQDLTMQREEEHSVLENGGSKYQRQPQNA